MAQKMINMVGVDSVHAWFCPVKQATGNVGRTNKFWYGH
jgi:hypothetical protein